MICSKRLADAQYNVDQDMFLSNGPMDIGHGFLSLW